VPNGSDHSTASSELSPKQRLEPPNVDLLTAGIVSISDIETVQACVAYENTHQNRVRILRRLASRAETIRAETE
jgi:hypothetical protein